MKPTQRERKLLDAKETLLRQIGDQSWLRGIGIGLVDESPGLVLSVSARGKEPALAAIAALEERVRVRVQVVGPIRKRNTASR